jgi:iron complex transport system substrate-binding protein
MNKNKMIKILVSISFMLMVSLVHSKQRIVSAGGSVTEILFELGLGDQIIAVDSSSTFPTEMQNKPQIGYFRSLSAEGVLALNPTLIAGSNGAGPDETLAQILQAGVNVKVFKQESYSLESWKSYMTEVATYFEVQEKADAIIKRVSKKLATLSTSHKSVDTIKAIFLLGLGERGPIAAGKKTVPNMLFNMANMENMVTQYEGFKPYSTEELIKNKPDLIVMPAHVAKKLGGRDQICKSMIIKLATKNQGCKLLIMDPLLALGFGTRIDQAVEMLVTHGR